MTKKQILEYCKGLDSEAIWDIIDNGPLEVILTIDGHKLTDLFIYFAVSDNLDEAIIREINKKYVRYKLKMFIE